MTQNKESLDKLHALELMISHLLRAGVVIAGLFLAIGWLWLWHKNGDLLHSFTTYQPQPFIETIHWALVTDDRPLFISMLGLVILVLLPIIRVFMTGVLFFKQKEKTLGLMALVVFVALIGSVLLGIDI